MDFMTKNHFKFKFVFLLIITFSFIQSGLIQAQSKKITVNDAITIALENNREAKIARLNVIKASSAVDQVLGNAYPSLDFSANYFHYLQKMKMPFPDFQALLTNATYSILFDEKVLTRDNSKYLPMNTTLQSFSLFNNYQATFQVSQVLFNSSVLEGIGAAKNYRDLSKDQLYSTAFKTIHDIKSAFYGILLTKEMLIIMEASLKNANDNLSNVRLIFNQGFATEFDTLQVAVRAENIKPVILQLQNQTKNSINGLKVLMGIDQSQDIDITGSLDYTRESLPELESTIQKAFNTNIDLQTLTSQKEFNEALIRVDKSGYWPMLSAYGNYTFQGASDDFNFQHYPQAMIGLSLSMNLFNGFQTTKKVEQSTITVQQTSEQIAQFKDYLSSQIKAKILELQRVQGNIEAQDHNIQLAQRAYEISNERYIAGTGTQIEIENSDIALRMAKSNRLQSVYDYLVAKNDLENILGQCDTSYNKLIEK
jgi:outer membrane protein